MSDQITYYQYLFDSVIVHNRNTNQSIVNVVTNYNTASQIEPEEGSNQKEYDSLGDWRIPFQDIYALLFQ